MGKEGTWQNKNVDLKQLSEKIKKFFYANKFSEVQNFDDPSGSYIQIQARKTGRLQSLTSQRKSIQITIRGDANNFLIAVSEGEWGKNLTYATLFNPGVSLIGMGRNASFNKKLWNFIKDTVESLENTYKQSITSTETKTESPLEILQKRLALGEITKEEFNELKSVFENKEVQSDNETEQNSDEQDDEQDDEPQPVNSARWV
jgi:hypothetical protein